MTNLDEFRAEVLSALYDIRVKLATIEKNTTKKVRKTPEKAQLDMVIEDQFSEILGYWNQWFGKNLKDSKAHRDPIIARLNEGYEVSDFKACIVNKTDDPFFKENPQFFMPKTLYGNKMDVYLNAGVCRDTDKSSVKKANYEEDLLRGLEDEGL